MRIILAAVMAASALAMLAPLPVLATGHGFRGHFPGHLHAGRNYGNYRYGYGAGPYYGYGGIVAVPPYAPEAPVSYAPPTIVYVPEPPRALSCHRSQQTVTVPSEDGGTRQITVTRC